MLDHLFPLLFPKDSESLKILDIRLWEGGAKRPLNGTSKVNRQTNRQTDTRTHRRTFQLIESIGPEGQCFEKKGSWIAGSKHSAGLLRDTNIVLSLWSWCLHFEKKDMFVFLQNIFSRVILGPEICICTFIMSTKEGVRIFELGQGNSCRIGTVRHPGTYFFGIFSLSLYVWFKA